MADDTQIDSAVIQRTQQLLGKYIQRPQLVDKLLKRPPFRFIHDIVTAAINQYAIFPATFTLEELNSDNIKDKDGKVRFLEKLITATSAATGDDVKVRASKIVAGSEVERTNQLLQSLARVIELSQKSHTKPTKRETTKPSTTTKQPHKTSDHTKLKPTDTPAKVAKPVTKPRVEERGPIKPQTREKRSVTNAKETPSHTNGANNAHQKRTEHLLKPLNGTSKAKQTPIKAKQTPTKTKGVVVPESKPIIEPEPLPQSFENDTVAEVPAEGRELLGSADSGIAIDASPLKASQSPVNEETSVQKPLNNDRILELHNVEASSEITAPAEIINGHLSPPAVELESFEKPPSKLGSAVTRSFSARPKSSRRPPSRAGKEKFTLDLQPIMSKGSVPNVVVEGNEDVDEDSEDQIVDSAVMETPMANDFVPMSNTSAELVSGERGKLVEQILNARRELDGPEEVQSVEESGNQGSTAVLAEFERMKGLIQNAARAALPIGQLLPSVHEDVESMLKEWNYWKKEGNYLEEKLQSALSATDPELDFMRVELTNLENACSTYRTKLAAARAVIYQN